ncbi:MAG: phosphate ABC transporter permease subunit PstC [Clostridia bacterium]|nr:phosphate ABC transporter permease subunit PstC [Clostridia bacterium]
MNLKERIIKNILFSCALVTALSVVLITIFIFKEGFPIFFKAGLGEFLFGTKWLPTEGYFGIFPMIVGSVYVTIGALLLGVPVGISCAIFLAKIAKPKMANAIRPAIELLAGIPSVIYGFYGLIVIRPIIAKYFSGNGFSILTASIVLAIMILPTIINISEVSIKAVPIEYERDSLALGASRWQTIKRVILPAARNGIMTSIVLGLGRAIGETMAVMMVAGNRPMMPDSLFNPVRTLTSNIAIDMSYATGDHQSALFSTGVVLFVFIMVLNAIVNFIPRKVGE